MAHKVTSSVSILFPSWQREYDAARLESDPKRLPKRLEKAVNAIFNRMQALRHGETEWEDAQVAIRNMRTIQRETVDLHSPKTKQTKRSNYLQAERLCCVLEDETGSA